MAPRMYKRIGLMVAAASVLAQLVLAQGRGGGGGGGGTPPTGPDIGAGAGGAGTGTTTPAPTTRIPTTPQPNTQPIPQAMPQPIFISGRVLLEDGTAPTDQVVIERVCNGQARSEGYTDSKGFFGFELGRRNNGMLHDASEDANNDPFNSGAGGFGNTSRTSSQMPGMMGASDSRLMGCELRARLTGYRSQMVNLSMRRPLDNPDVGIILLHRLSPNEGGTISAISLAAPKDAKKAYEKGLDSVKKKKVDDALKSFEKAVELYPKYATAWYELGKIRLARADKEGAQTAFDSAVKADPKFVSPYLDLAVLGMQAQKWEQVVEFTTAAVKLDPFDYPQAYFFNAVANYNLKNVEAAEKSAREAERLDTRHSMLQNLHLLGIILAQRQDYQGAAERLRNYLKFAPATADVTNVKTQLDQLEKFVAQNPAAKQ